MNLIDAVTRLGKKPPTPPVPGRARFDAELARNAKPKRPRDNVIKSRRNQRQSSIGQALAGVIGGEMGPKQKAKTETGLMAALGGLSRIGLG